MFKKETPPFVPTKVNNSLNLQCIQISSYFQTANFAWVLICTCLKVHSPCIHASIQKPNAQNNLTNIEQRFLFQIGIPREGENYSDINN